MQGGDIGTIISTDELKNGLEDMSNIINSASQEISSIVNSGTMNTGDNKVSQKSAQTKNMLAKSTSFID